MAKQIRAIEAIGNGEKFILKTTNAETGKVLDANTFDGEKPMTQTAIATILGADYKALGNRRLAWLSMLGLVMADPTLDGYKGKGDIKAGSIAKEFKASVRSAEEKYLRALCAKDGGIKLYVPAGENAEKVFMSFCTSVREDKNYSNVKSTVMKYFAFCNAAPITKGGWLVPVAIMQAEIQNVLDANKEPADNSYTAQLRNILLAMDKDTNMKIDDVATAAPLAKQLYSVLSGIVAHAAELATHAATGLDTGVKDAADTVIADAAKGKTKAKGKATEAAPL